jgi:hypothetical protein
MTETIVLDPTAVAVNRTQLDITSWVKAPEGIDWGDAAISAFMADMAVGSGPVDFRLPNRQVKIPIILKDIPGTTFATIRANLQRKVGILQREGGWLLRQTDSTALYADIVNATLHLGGTWYQAYSGFDVDVTLSLELLPDFYGDEVALDTLSGTTPVVSTLKSSGVNAAIPGDYSARVRIQVSDTSGNDQKGVIWGFRSRYYDATAPLKYEAEALTGVNGTASVVLGGASGGSIMQNVGLPSGVWAAVLSTGALPHKGSYRVWIRAYSTATTPPSYRLQWGVGSLSAPVTNDPVQLPLPGSQFYMLDLGVMRLDPVVVGTHQWQGVIQAYVQTTNDQVGIDAVILQPLDESAGVASYVAGPVASSISSGQYGPETIADDAATGTVAWTIPAQTDLRRWDHVFDTVQAATPYTSHYLKATNCHAIPQPSGVGTGPAFAIPAGATIIGIRTDWVTQAPGASASAYSRTLRLVKAGVVQTGAPTSLYEYDSAGEHITSGGNNNTDLWGTTWTPTDVNNAGFGAALSISTVAGGPATIQADAVIVYVFYVLAAGFTVAKDAVVYASQTSEFRSDGGLRAAGGIYGPIAGLRGDLPRLPPSGLEARPVELIVDTSRGDLVSLPDAGLDTASVVVRYRPVYLFKA